MVDDQIVTVRVGCQLLEISWKHENEGSVKNHGVEFTLDQQFIKSNSFKWNANLNFGLNRGVASLPDQLTEIQGFQYSDIFPTAYLHGSTTAITGKIIQEPKMVRF